MPPENSLPMTTSRPAVPVRDRTEFNLRLRFGCFSDAHCSDALSRRRALPSGPDSFKKLAHAVSLLNARNLDFIIELGDLKDVDATATREGTLRCLQKAEAAFAAFDGPRYHVVGNHDCDLITLSDFLDHTANAGAANGRNYYSFNAGGVKCIVLDACYVDTAENHHSPRRDSWMVAWIPEAELAWLEQELRSGTEPILVFVHQLLNYWDAGISFEPHFVIRNAREVVAMLEAAGRVLAVFSGHYHQGFRSEKNGIRYFVARALTTSTSPHAAVDIVTVDDPHHLRVEELKEEPSGVANPP